MNKFNQKIKYSNKKLYFSTYITNFTLILLFTKIAIKSDFFIKKIKTYPIYKIQPISPNNIKEEDKIHKLISENKIESDFLKISLTGKKMSLFKQKEVILKTFKSCENGYPCSELELNENLCEDKIEKKKEFAKWCFDKKIQDIFFYNLENIIINLKTKNNSV